MRMNLMASVAVLLLLATPAAWADTVIKMKTHTESMTPGAAPSTDEVSTIWLGTNKLREDKQGQSVIVNLDEKKMYILRHGEKIYHAIDLPLDLRAMVPEEARSQFDMMAAQMEMEVTITPTDQTREIAGYASKLYQVALKNPMGMEMDMELWLSTDLNMDVDLYKNLTMEMLSAQPMGAEWIKQILALEGFRVLQETKVRMMGTEVKASEELLSVEEMDAPANNYSPPEGYGEKPFDLMSMMGGGS
jgi:hypothetical protein